ncbi:unnamed protein product [Adineta ricciae]|uniref:Uncharacterized protein n=1 Tax=Adineta ricciae TaxID=249248 RepID=A0A814A173_ADIRI|nr:unnamed protein product [Adineta ricciae]
MEKSYPAKLSAFTSINSDEQSPTTICGEGYIYTGPLSSQCYQLPSKCVEEVKSGTTNNETNNQYQFKVMLLGDSGVGKTCLLIRFNDGAFLTGSFITTVGIDYRSKVVTLGDKKINLQIFDTAGQERYRSVTHSYYRDAHALLLLYDITSYSSFENISSWLSEIKECTQNDIIIMLIGNKVDKSQRVVSRESGERLARDFQISFLETSAKTGQNVELAFMATAQALLDKKINETNAHLLLNDLVKTNNSVTHYSCC